MRLFSTGGRCYLQKNRYFFNGFINSKEQAKNNNKENKKDYEYKKSKDKNGLCATIFKNPSLEWGNLAVKLFNK